MPRSTRQEMGTVYILRGHITLIKFFPVTVKSPTLLLFHPAFLCSK